MVIRFDELVFYNLITTYVVILIFNRHWRDICYDNLTTENIEREIRNLERFVMRTVSKISRIFASQGFRFTPLQRSGS